MIASHADFQRYNPLRPLDWRWQRALHLVANGQNFSQRRDDEPTRAAVLLARALGASNANGELNRLRRRMPELYDAHRLRCDSGPLTWLVEASLLARQSTEACGKRYGVPAAVVDVYESLFYCVRDRLDARLFVYKRACSGADTKPDLRSLLAWLGFHGGEVVLNTSSAVLLPELAAGSSVQPTIAAPTADKIRLLADQWVLPAGAAKSQTTFMQLAARLAKMTPEEGVVKQSPLDGVFDEIVNETIEQLPATVEESPSEDITSADSNDAKPEDREVA